jgi:hypothetical protein
MPSFCDFRDMLNGDPRADAKAAEQDEGTNGAEDTDPVEGVLEKTQAAMLGLGKNAMDMSPATVLRKLKGAKRAQVQRRLEEQLWTSGTWTGNNAFRDDQKWDPVTEALDGRRIAARLEAEVARKQSVLKNAASGAGAGGAEGGDGGIAWDVGKLGPKPTWLAAASAKLRAMATAEGGAGESEAECFQHVTVSVKSTDMAEEARNW